MAARTLEKPRAGNGPPAVPGEFGDWWRRRPEGEPDVSRLGIWFALAAIAMLFVGFTATYLTRRAAGDWVAAAPPPILWATTAILLLSSAAIERARRRIARGDAAGLRRGLWITAALGAAFLAGQVTAWQQLRAAGIFMATTPQAAFFYLLTGAHGLHLLGGLVGLGVVLAGAQRAKYSRASHGGVDAVATYWHFMDALWLYLFAILFVV